MNKYVPLTLSILALSVGVVSFVLKSIGPGIVAIMFSVFLFGLYRMSIGIDKWFDEMDRNY